MLRFWRDKEADQELQERRERARTELSKLGALIGSKGWTEYVMPYMEQQREMALAILLTSTNRHPEDDVRRGAARAFTDLQAHLDQTIQQLRLDAGLEAESDETTENDEARRFG